jgi:hypothetical protein
MMLTVTHAVTLHRQLLTERFAPATYLSRHCNTPEFHYQTLLQLMRISRDSSNFALLRYR